MPYELPSNCDAAPAVPRNMLPRRLLYICLCALVLRFAAGAYQLRTRGITGDKNWHTLAMNLLDGKGLIMDTPNVTTVQNYRSHRPPLFPMVLAGVGAVTARNTLVAVFVLALISAAVVVPVYWIGVLLFGTKVGYCSATLTMLYPFFVIHDATFMESGLYCLLIACFVVAIIRFYRLPRPFMAGVAGVSFGLAALTRGTCAPVGVFTVLWFFLMPPCPMRERLKGLVLFLACAGILLLPWLARNYTLHGSLVYVTGGGRSLWMGNNEIVGAMYPSESIDRVEWAAWDRLTPDERNHVRSLREKDTDIWFKRQAVAYVKTHPWQTAVLAMRKIWAGFSPFMNPTERGELLKHLVYSVSYGPVLMLGLIGIVTTRARWREYMPMAMVAAAFILLSAVYWAHSRHRVFLDVYLIVFASHFIIHLSARFFPKRVDHANEDVTRAC